MIYPTAPHHFLFYLCLITYYWGKLSCNTISSTPDDYKTLLIVNANCVIEVSLEPYTPRNANLLVNLA